MIKSTPYLQFCWAFSGFLFFFIIGCVKLGDAIGGASFRMYLTQPEDLPFPTWTICPQLNYQIKQSACSVINRQNHRPYPTIIPSKSVQAPSGATCVAYNPAGDLFVGDNYIECTSTVSNGDDTDVPSRIFFDQPGSNFSRCTGCIGGTDNFLLTPGHSTTLGLELSLFQDSSSIPEYTQTYTDRIPDGIPTHAYRLSGQSVYVAELGNVSRSTIFWNSKVVTHYERFRFFDFWLWMGYLGGTAYLLKMLHNFVMWILANTVWKHQNNSSSQYSALE